VRAGWQAAWVGHREGTLLSTCPPLRAAEPTLLAVAEALTAHGRSAGGQAPIRS
jgi:hypothetical protein